MISSSLITSMALMILYFLPSMIGGNKKNSAAIVMINFVFGWTVIGWLIALYMAMTGEKKENSTKWYHTTNSMVIGFLVVGPLILPAIWTHPTFSKNKKIVITLIVVGLTVLLMVSLAGVLKSLLQQLKDLEQAMGVGVQI